MQKIYCNKETNMVEQILKINSEDELPDTYFNNCYAVLDLEDNINSYNLKYNKEIEEFEIVEGIPARDEVEVIKQPTMEDFKKLENENMELKSQLEERVRNIEEMLNINREDVIKIER